MNYYILAINNKENVVIGPYHYILDASNKLNGLETDNRFKGFELKLLIEVK